MSSPPAPARWQIIVPVRGGLLGKTRLARIEGRSLSDVDRARLALAMAHDTITAAVASGCGWVRVLTADEQVAALATSTGASVVLDEGRGLNAELVAAARSLSEDGAESPGIACLLGDLPALRPGDLREALARAQTQEGWRVYVPDWEGTGTALAAMHPRGGRIRLAFGPDSARQHADLGLTAVGHDLDRLRCDVDTAEAWERAVSLGLGPATTTVRASVLGGAAAVAD